jgi:hypothetical protein
LSFCAAIRTRQLESCLRPPEPRLATISRAKPAGVQARNRRPQQCAGAVFFSLSDSERRQILRCFQLQKTAGKALASQSKPLGCGDLFDGRGAEGPSSRPHLSELGPLPFGSLQTKRPLSFPSDLSAKLFRDEMPCRPRERYELKRSDWRALALKAATWLWLRAALLRHEFFCFRAEIERAPLNLERNRFRGV